MQSKSKQPLRKHFVTLFPAAVDIHLIKDVGQIPFILARDFGYDSTLVTESDSAFSSLPSDTPGLVIKRLTPYGKSSLVLASFAYLVREARNIDVLNLYHMRLQTKMATLLYKALNRKGIVYVKLDMDVFAEREALQQQAAPKRLRNALRDLLNRRFFDAVNLFSGESQEAVALAGQRFPALRAKTIEITNGLDLSRIQTLCPLLPFQKKEDLIITVGRLGTYQKNNEVLLDALRQVRLGHWKVALIGPYSAEFEQAFEALLLARPELKDVVQLVGNVRDRAQLMDWYSRAKAFVLTSRFEGFPLIFGEAQSYANYMISSDVSSIREILAEERYGKVFGTTPASGLPALLQDFVDHPVYTEVLAGELTTYAATKYEWRTILRALDLNLTAGRHA